jgi:hypothetical protein
MPRKVVARLVKRPLQGTHTAKRNEIVVAIPRGIISFFHKKPENSGQSVSLPFLIFASTMTFP